MCRNKEPEITVEIVGAWKLPLKVSGFIAEVLGCWLRI